MTRFAFACLALLLSAPLAVAQESAGDRDSSKITIGQTFSMHSEILGEDRAYSVYLPDSYENNGSRGYPVMYILDGAAHFQSATGVVQFMSSGINGNRQIPELIVVAIPNTNRYRDLTPTQARTGYDGEPTGDDDDSGGGGDFLRFINDELFVEIESTYRTMPHRTFVGHSLGGLMALYALLDFPDMFQAYISIDPSMWWDGEILTPRANEVFADPTARSGSVYISQAHPLNLSDNPELMRNASTAFANVLATAESPQFRTKVDYFPKEDHGSVPLISLYHGLLHVFDGYRLSVDAVANDPTEITTHFESLSEKLGFRIIPPENQVNNIGYFLLQRMEDVDGAITVFEMNVANYPESANVYDSLGEAFAVSGDVDKAIRNYEKSLALDPGNDNAKNELEKLRDTPVKE
jgi:predicted alpha/beta superfamily hydrolase